MFGVDAGKRLLGVVCIMGLIFIFFLTIVGPLMGVNP